MDRKTAVKAIPFTYQKNPAEEYNYRKQFVNYRQYFESIKSLEKTVQVQNIFLELLMENDREFFTFRFLILRNLM